MTWAFSQLSMNEKAERTTSSRSGPEVLRVEVSTHKPVGFVSGLFSARPACQSLSCGVRSGLTQSKEFSLVNILFLNNFFL